MLQRMYTIQRQLGMCASDLARLIGGRGEATYCDSLVGGGEVPCKLPCE